MTSPLEHAPEPPGARPLLPGPRLLRPDPDHRAAGQPDHRTAGHLDHRAAGEPEPRVLPALTPHRAGPEHPPAPQRAEAQPPPPAPTRHPTTEPPTPSYVPADAAYQATGRYDPWPELPDDSPLWTPVRPVEDARHLRELAAEQRGD
ncbi:hypothetical protein [Phytohabitans houttuyneae]|nr:hypothetical protein [Phytohabitans houttuyneae]